MSVFIVQAGWSLDLFRSHTQTLSSIQLSQTFWGNRVCWGGGLIYYTYSLPTALNQTTPVMNVSLSTAFRSALGDFCFVPVKNVLSKTSLLIQWEATPRLKKQQQKTLKSENEHRKNGGSCLVKHQTPKIAFGNTHPSSVNYRLMNRKGWES